jgi:hypothetical protein
MKKVQFWAIFWTLILAIPITALALMASAYITDHIDELNRLIPSTNLFTIAKYRDLILEIEALAMIIAVAIVVIVILFSLQPKRGENEVN